VTVDLSANTAAYSETPAPLGRPGGPGLWRVKGLKLPDYIENVAKGIMQGGEADKSRAIALAIGAVKRWASGAGKVSPEVRAAAAKAVAEWEALKAAHVSSHANEAGGAVALSWNGADGIDLASVELGGYLPPHVPAGSSAGGQFGTTAGGASKTPAGKTAKAPASAKGKNSAQARAAGLAQRAALHAQANALRAKAQAIEARITALNVTIAAQVKAAAAAAAKPKASATAKAKAAVAKAATKKAAPKAAAKVTAKKATVAQNRATVKTLHSQAHGYWMQARALDAQAAAVKLSGGDGVDFLELAFAEALAERVPPGVPEGGQFAAAAVRLTRHDTPEMAARAVNAMERPQRAAVRASTLPPPGYEWSDADRLAVAE